MERSSHAASSALRVSTPAWSRLEANAIMPQRDTRPEVGLMPVRPQKEAGRRIEPPVSLAVAAGHRWAATAAAEPPEEPPGTRSVFQGLCTGPYQLVSLEEPMANSSILVLPSVMAPSAARRSTMVAS